LVLLSLVAILLYINCLQVDYNFYKVFAYFISEVAKDEDKYWINQKIIEIQAPDSYDEILKAFNNIVKVEQIISKTAKHKIALKSLNAHNDKKLLVNIKDNFTKRAISLFSRIKSI
jgi:hypothetical protein